MSDFSSSVPDPSGWILACVSGEKKKVLEAWRRWLVWHAFPEWTGNERKRFAPETLPPGELRRRSEGLWVEWHNFSAFEKLHESSWSNVLTPWALIVAKEIGLTGDWRRPSIEGVVVVTCMMMRLEWAGRHADSNSPDELEARNDRDVWKQCVRIRQYLAEARVLARDLPRSSMGAFKTWWFASLEWTRVAEKMGARVFDEPIQLGAGSRLHIAWQRWFGRHAFKG